MKGKEFALISAILSTLIVILLIAVIALNGRVKKAEVDTTTTTNESTSVTQSTSVETTQAQTQSTEEETDDGYVYEDDSEYPAIDEYMTMLENSEIVKAGTSYDLYNQSEDTQDFEVHLNFEKMTIQSVKVFTPSSEDDDNYGMVTGAIALTENFVPSSSSSDTKYTVLFNVAMTPIMPILAPDKPITYALTIVENSTENYWHTSEHHCTSGTENGIPWLVIYKTDGKIVTACGQEAIDYVWEHF